MDRKQELMKKSTKDFTQLKRVDPVIIQFPALIADYGNFDPVFLFDAADEGEHIRDLAAD